MHPTGSGEIRPPLRGKRRRSLRTLWWTLAAVPLATPLLFYGCIQLAHPSAGPQHIRVAADTTYYTAPLDGAGHVDYAAAINDELSQNLRPEDNAAVIYWQSGVIAPMKNELYIDEVAAILGVERSALHADSSLSLFDFMRQMPQQVVSPPLSDELSDLQPGEPQDIIAARFAEHFAAEDWVALHQLLIAQRQWLYDLGDDEAYWPAYVLAHRFPWTTEAYPHVAEYLQHSAPVLEQLAAASKLPRYYSPLAGGEAPPFVAGSMVSDVIAMPYVGRAFARRAMLRLGEGNVLAAWEDVLTIHRWARLIAQAPSMAAYLAAEELEHMAIDAEECLIASSHATREQLERIEQDLRALPAFPAPVATMQLDGRCMYLECVQSHARIGGAFALLESPELYSALDTDPTPLPDWWINQIVDWNQVLKLGNEHFDSLIDAIEQPTYQQQVAACDKLERSHIALTKQATATPIAVCYFTGPAMERRLAAIYLGVLGYNGRKVIDGRQKVVTRRQLVEIALGLAKYRADHGQLPAALAELTPKYCATAAVDDIDQQPFGYLPREDGFTVYSAGVDGRDNRGIRNWHIHDGDLQQGDDIVFQSPPRMQFEVEPKSSPGPL